MSCKKILTLMLISCLLITNCVFGEELGYAIAQDVIYENLSKNDSYDTDVIECAEKIEEALESEAGDEGLEVVDDSDELDEEIIQDNYNANAEFNIIVEHVTEFDDELREHFSSGYIDEDNKLIVLLDCESGFCEEFILTELECTNVMFAEGEGSYYETQLELDKINEMIYDFQNSILMGNELNKNAQRLMSFKPKASYSGRENIITITFNSEEPSDEAISLFQGEIPDCECLEYSFDVEDCEIVDDTTVWRPGRKLVVYNSSTGAKSGLSTGYRSKYTYSGTTYYGFVTAGHGTAKGSGVYITTTISSTYKLGSILNRSYGGSVDVSFIKMTNSNYTNSNAIYYTSSQAGVTRQGTVLDGTQTTVASGALIYKSGATTYLTSGYVSLTSDAFYMNDIYFYNIIKADRAMTDSGDSGAVTYVTSGTNSGKAIGIVKGKANGKSIFVRASCIKSAFGAQAY